MKLPLFLFGRLVLVCLPQTFLSSLAIHAYVRAGAVFPAGAVAHVGMILALQVLFFSSWTLWSRRVQGSHQPWFRRLFAFTCLAKWMLLNPVYLASYASYSLWGEYLSRDNLRAIGPHLQGFHLAFGSLFRIGVGVIGLLLLGYLLLALRTAGPLLRWLDFPPAGRPSVLLTGLLVAVATATALHLGFHDRSGIDPNMRDPLIAFWSNQAAAAPLLTPEMLADRAVAQEYQVPAQFSRRNVIILVIDCLRADHLSFRGYVRETTPYLSSLYHAGRLHPVDFAVANGNDSPTGIRSILNSRAPHRQNIHNFRLQDLLKQAGYRTHLIGTGDHTSLAGMRAHYGPHFDVFLDGLTRPNASIHDDRGLLESLDTLGPADGRPAFFYIHLMSPHELGVRESTFARWSPATLTLDFATVMAGAANRQTAINTYDNGLLQADHYVREIFARLEAKGYLHDYVAVIAGDHGQGLGDRGHYGHTRYLYAEDVVIPILFLESGPANYGPLPFASQVDIAPTLLDRLGLPVPARWEGRSLHQSAPPETAVLVGRRENGWRAIVRRRDDGIFKYIFNGTRRAGFEEGLYDSGRDPTDRNNLAKNPAHQELLLEMRTRAAKEFGRPVPPLN